MRAVSLCDRRDRDHRPADRRTTSTQGSKQLSSASSSDHGPLRLNKASLARLPKKDSVGEKVSAAQRSTSPKKSEVIEVSKKSEMIEDKNEEVVERPRDPSKKDQGVKNARPGNTNTNVE